MKGKKSVKWLNIWAFSRSAWKAVARVASLHQLPSEFSLQRQLLRLLCMAVCSRVIEGGGWVRACGCPDMTHLCLRARVAWLVWWGVYGSVTQLVSGASGGRLQWLMQYPASSPNSSSRGLFHSLLAPRPGDEKGLYILYFTCNYDFLFLFVCSVDKVTWLDGRNLWLLLFHDEMKRLSEKIEI